MKEGVSEEALCDGLPGEFAAYINYTRRLAFDDKPDYSYLRRLFHRLFQAKGFEYDHLFDWTEKLFDEVQSAHGAIDTEAAKTSSKGKDVRERPTMAPNPKGSKRDLVAERQSTSST